MLRATSEHKLYGVVCASAIVPNPVHHPEFFQTGVPRPENLEPLAVALILCFILALALGLFSREGCPQFCSTAPSFPAVGASHKHPLHCNISGYPSRKAFSESALVFIFTAETERNFGLASQEELPVPARRSAAHPTSRRPLVSLPGLLSLILFDNVFFLHLASQLTSKPYHI